MSTNINQEQSITLEVCNIGHAVRQSQDLYRSTRDLANCASSEFTQLSNFENLEIARAYHLRSYQKYTLDCPFLHNHIHYFLFKFVIWVKKSKKDEIDFSQVSKPRICF